MILTGAGDKAFAAGADIAAMSAMGPEEARRFSELGRRLADRVDGLPVPVIAAVNGFALGGGLELALLCDFMLASSNAKLGQPEVNVGVLPGLRRARSGWCGESGSGPARQLLYTGELVGAEEARALGLVNEVTAPPDLLPRARALAGRIASRAPLAVAAVKRAIRAGEDLPLDRGVLFEQGEFAACSVPPIRRRACRPSCRSAPRSGKASDDFLCGARCKLRGRADANRDSVRRDGDRDGDLDLGVSRRRHACTWRRTSRCRWAPSWS